MVIFVQLDIDIGKYMETTRINLAHDDGYLWVCKADGKFYWCIEDYYTDIDDLSCYIEIPESLYNELLKVKYINPYRNETN